MFTDNETTVLLGLPAEPFMLRKSLSSVLTTIILALIFPLIGEAQCPTGYEKSPSTNTLLVNGDFSIQAGTTPSPGILTTTPAVTPGPLFGPLSFYSQAGRNANGLYSPANNGGPSNPGFDNTFSLQSTSIPPGTWFGVDNANTFPGDPANGVSAVSTWYYSNGNYFANQEYVLWGQQLTGLVIGKTYTFYAYVNNIAEPPANLPDDPRIRLRMGGNPGLPNGTQVAPVLPTPYLELSEVLCATTQPLGGWIRIEHTFTATATTEVFKVTSAASGVSGDDFGLTAIGVVECRPLVTASSNSPVCLGATLTLTAGTPAAGTMTYAWTGPNGYVASGASVNRPNMTLADYGVYTVTITDALGASNTASVTVTQRTVGCTEICNNSIDDDSDGLIDCLDPDCYLVSNTGGTDTDGDGLDNNCDLDDDNDGILDDTENLCISGSPGQSINTVPYPFNTLLNTSTTNSPVLINNLANGLVNVRASLFGTANWVTASGSAPNNGGGVQIKNNFPAIGDYIYFQPENTPNTGNDYALYEIDFTQPVQGFRMIGAGLNFSDAYEIYAYNGATNVSIGPSNVSNLDIDNGQVWTVNNATLGPDFGVFVSQSNGFGGTSVTENTFTLNIPSTITRVVIRSYKASSSTGFVTTGFTSFQVCSPIDSDGDGLVNSLDLDSDGDGCADAIEGGGSFTAANMVSSSIPGGNSGGGYTGSSPNPVTDNLGITVNITPSSAAFGVPTAAGAGQSLGTSLNGAAQDPACIISEICNNGIDDDGDGLIDLADPDCRPLCSGTSGNLLVNPDFELPVVPQGNNVLTWPIPGWTGIGTNPNVVRPNGVFSGGGPLNAQNGGQYLDIANGAADFWQEFTFSCNTRVFFSGYFSIRDGFASNGRIDLYRVDGGLTLVASSNQLNMPAIMDVWYLASGSAVITPGTYRFQISMGDYSNFDNACFSFDDPGVSTGSYGPVCSSGGNITLTGTPTNAFGTWSGTGVTNNGNGTATFNPSGLSGQNITVTYSYLDAGSVGCNESTTISVICCSPTVTAPTVTQPTCSANSGSILVNASAASSMQFSINGAAGPFQSSPVFAGLSPGNYNIRARIISEPSCFTDYSANPVVIAPASGCPEICGNGLDDDGDGLSDCNDPDCGVGTPGPISVPTLCGGTSVTFSVPAVAGATTYNWTVPAGSLITAGQGTNSITVLLGSSAGNVCVTASNANCTSPNVCQAIAITVIPAAPSQIIRN